VAATTPVTAAASGPIDAIVVTATRIPEPAEQIPAGISVVSGRELIARGAADLAGVLGLVPGVEAPSGGDAGPSSAVLSFWGLHEFDAFLLVVDGAPWGGAFNPAFASSVTPAKFGPHAGEGLDPAESSKGPVHPLGGEGTHAKRPPQRGGDPSARASLPVASSPSGASRTTASWPSGALASDTSPKASPEPASSAASPTASLAVASSAGSPIVNGSPPHAVARATAPVPKLKAKNKRVPSMRARIP